MRIEKARCLMEVSEPESLESTFSSTQLNSTLLYVCVCYRMALVGKERGLEIRVLCEREKQLCSIVFDKTRSIRSRPSSFFSGLKHKIHVATSSSPDTLPSPLDVRDE